MARICRDVQPCLQKYFASPVGQIISTSSRHPTPPEGRWPSSRTRGGMRWTRQRLARDGIAGQVERLVSGHRHADERCCSVRQNRVVLTPRRWRQVLRSCVGPTGLRQNLSADDGGKRARSPGRARHKLLKPLRAGTSGDSGVLVVTRVRSITTIAHEAAGALGIRRSPRPLWAENKCNASSAPRCEDAAVCETISTSLQAKRSNPSRPAKKDGLLRFARNDGSRPWNAARSPSSPAHSRDPVARNDDEIWFLRLERYAARRPRVAALPRGSPGRLRRGHFFAANRRAHVISPPQRS